jgi:hypothetical protein
MNDSERYFIHRWNSDRTIDSVCSFCNLRVCSERSLLRAQECEAKHACPAWSAAGFIGELGKQVHRSRKPIS